MRDFSRMRARLEESLALYRTLGEDGEVAGPLTHLGDLKMLVENDIVGARVLLNEALAATARTNDDYQKSTLLESLCRAALLGREYEEAERFAEEWLQLAQRMGDRSSATGALAIRGMTVINRGETGRARRLFDAALAESEGLGEVFWTSGSLFGLGIVSLIEKNYPATRDYLTQAHALLGPTAYDYVKHYTLEVWAYLLAAEGDMRRAARLLGALDQLTASQSVTAPIFPDCFTPHMAMIRESLGERELAREKAAGAPLTLEKALAHAQEPPSPSAP
jgi:hypothetical protein